MQKKSLSPTRYIPAVLSVTDKNWEICYFVENPQSGKMQRFRIRMNRIVKRFPRKADAKKYCLDVVSNLNMKLLDGWNPFFEGEDSRLYTPITGVCELYVKEKAKELRPDSLRSYVSFTNLLLAWVSRFNENLFCSMFDKAKATRFMDYVYNERNVAARTYNNYIKQARCFFDWAVQKGYAKENPFLKFTLKKKAKKERTIIDPETRHRIAMHLEGKPFLLVCMLVYHSLIRPKEIRNLRVGDIDLKKHSICVGSDIAKNHNTRYAAISPQIESLIKDLGVTKYPKTDYIFSDVQTLGPGPEKLYDAKFTKEFAKLRKELGLPAAMQLYSFRDTGIFEMLKANIDDLSVMQHADHSSLDMTTIYANHYDENLTDIINKKAPEF